MEMARIFKPEWRKRVPARCINCDVTFMAVEAEIKRGKGKCCSRGCASGLAAFSRDSAGSSNGNWRGGITKDAKRHYEERYPLKHRAHRLVTKALRQKRLFRKPCEACGDERSEAHHDNYHLPLCVRWLCREHHLEHHRQAKPGPQHLTL